MEASQMPSVLEANRRQHILPRLTMALADMTAAAIHQTIARQRRPLMALEPKSPFVISSHTKMQL